MRCPLCVNETLDAHHRGGIEIDICPRCRGIWLDRGELDRLVHDVAERRPTPPPAPLAASGHLQPSPPPARPTHSTSERRERSDQDHKRKKKRKKSPAERLVDILEDVFD